MKSVTKNTVLKSTRNLRSKAKALFYFQASVDTSFKLIKVDYKVDELGLLERQVKLGAPIWQLFSDASDRQILRGLKAKVGKSLAQTLRFDLQQKSVSLSCRVQKIGKTFVCMFSQEPESALQDKVDTITSYQLNALMAHSDDSIVYLDNAFKILNFNELASLRSQRAYGLKLKCGNDFRDYIPKAVYEKYMAALKKCLKGKAMKINLDLPAKKGTIWVELSMKPVFDKEKRVIGAVLSFKNIDALLKAEQAIAKAKEKLNENDSILRAFLINSNDAIAILDLKFKIIALNDTMIKFTKKLYGQSMSVGDDYLSYVPEDLKASLYEDYKNVLEGGTSVKDLLVKVGSNAYWFQFKVAGVLDNKKNLIGLALTAQNIHDQKKAELVLQKNEEKFKMIIEQAAMPMVLVNAKCEINMVNSEAEHLLLFDKGDLIGKNVGILFQQNQKLTKKALINVFDLKDGEAKMYNNKNKAIDIDLHVRRMTFDDQTFTILSFKDITEHLLIQNQIHKTNHELHLLTKVNDLILSAHSHDQLFKRLCKCIVEEGRYKLAWISKIEYRIPEFIIPEIAYGATGYLKDFKISLRSKAHLKGPSATAYLTGKISMLNNVNTSPNFKPWLKRANKFDIAASCVIPLLINSKVVGVCNIYSDEPNAFDANELSIMERLGKNVSSALENLNVIQQKNNTVFQLNKRMKELRTIYLINKMLKDDNVTFDQLIKSATEIIPAGWMHAEHCQVKIIFDNKEYYSQDYLKPVDNYSVMGTTHDGKPLLIDVSYQKKFPDEYQGPFLKEEIDLMNALLELFIMNYNKFSIHQSLTMSEANLKSVIENTNVGHLLLDKDYRIILFSESLGNLYSFMSNLKLEEKKSIFEYVSPNLKLVVENIFNEVKATKQPFIYEFEADGIYGKRYFTSTVVPVFDFQDQNSYSISVYDITKIKSMEVEREKMISDLMQRNRDLEQFSYIVSHNIRSPLATLLGFSALLKNNVSDEDKAIILQGMQDSAAKLDNTIKDVNEILNIKKDLAQSKNEINLEELLVTVKETLEGNIKASNAQITSDFSKINKIYSINPYIHSIFFNLIGNAIKYAKRNVPPQIHVSTEIQGTNIVISFKDNGMGIDLNKHGAHLFGLYKKFNFEIEGKGMGLFMVKTQIQALEGKIEVNSEPEQGTTFVVTLPIF